MGLLDQMYARIANEVASRLVGDPSGNAVIEARKYRLGMQKAQLKVQPGQYNDNITENLCGVITDRAVSQLVGYGMRFNFQPEEGGLAVASDERSAQEAWFEACLDANRWEILFQRMALSAAEAGTGFITFQADGVVGEDGRVYPRVINLNPEFVSIETLPDDFEIVQRYRVEYKTTGLDGKEIGRRREYELDPESGRWLITTYEGQMGGFQVKWVEVDQVEWPWPFAPVLHWQNLPSIDSTYGRPEIGPDGYELQDRINAVNSNMSKLIRLYAHPKQALVNASAGDKLDVGPDQVLRITTDGQSGSGFQVYPQMGDLKSSADFVSSLRRVLFDITRTVDLASLEDRLGEITNYGLRVLYQDNLAKLQTKRLLWEEMVEEMGRRLFIMGGIEPMHFEVVWPEVMPINEMERAQFDQMLLAMGVVSKETIADQTGLNWEQEMARIQAEQAMGDNVGAALLRAFNNGQ